MKADIVVIDDTPDNLRLLVGILSQHGYAVRPFSEGAFALNAIRETPPDLILLDIKMPGMNGFEVCEQLKADERTRDIPVVFISALGDIQDKVKGFNAGGVDYIIKPFQAEEVLARVKTHVALRNAQAALEEKNQQLEQEIGRRIEAEEELRAMNEQLNEANQRLETANQELHDANASKDKFFSIIAHDLRTPFTGLIGLTEALIENLEAYTVDKLRSLLERVHAASEHTYALLTNLLTWSRLERGHIECHPEVHSLRAIAENAVYLLASGAEQKKIALQNDLSPDLMVYVDIYMIQTVFRNLLSNALKFTHPGGSITVSARENGDDIEIVVTDTGIGMDRATLEGLFRIDVKTSKPGTAGEEGTGLGLILCKELVEKNGGSIRVESDIGKGSRFIVLLPEKK